ncbi:SMP-30/gluconolactonase/LRE family protein [Subtercola sp. RTI3]|uniref:SMP-30/gluconolactonase/LRE family protein n=1 Tax=Subtercola sp. RTI3 TaxID=3048639 RepID=UPI002B23D915|nr:SMP-30/gluconolactonase/LRE family protein [Subtercola sp. RTI3]MEA9986718.1 SMP-30/gluconolactonase/LRE family protein [Subtercola sp. RTI3]
MCTATAATATQVVIDPLVSLGAGSVPRSIAVGPNGEFYTANYGAGTVTGFNASGASLNNATISLGGGAAPRAIARDSFGALWIADAGTASVSRYVPGEPSASTYSLGGTRAPGAVAVDHSSTASADTIYAADSVGNSIWEVTQSGGLISPISQFATLAAGALPKGIVTDSMGNVYTANSGTSTVSKITPGGVVTDKFAEFSPGDGPDAITIDSHGILYVANYVAGTVAKVDSTKPAGANVVGTFTLAPDAHPLGITVDMHDNVYVSNSGPNTVSMIPAGSNSSPLTILTLPNNAGASGIVVSSTNTLLVTGFGNNTVTSLDLSTSITTTSLTSATVGKAFTQTITATGVDPITFASTDLPSWLTLSADGTLSGTPTADGAYSFSVTATGPTGSSISKNYTIEVAAVNTGGGTGGTGAPAGGTGAGSGNGAGTGGSGATATLAHTGTSGPTLAGFAGTAAAIMAIGLALTSFRRRLSLQRNSR